MRGNKSDRNTARRINVLCIFTIGLLFFTAMGCSEALARKPLKTPQGLRESERLEAEQRLFDMGYWVGPVDGKFDSSSRHALVAFQKVEGRPRNGNLTSTELIALRNATRPTALKGGSAHAEIDLARQVLFLVDDSGTITRILPVSTGNDKLYVDQGRVQRAHTPTGNFKVLRKINGTRISTLGLLYYPSYIMNGIAIHGSLSIPPYPDSHGCIRVPMFAARELSALMPVGMEVVIYDERSRT
jgi:hypothetical protein